MSLKIQNSYRSCKMKIFVILATVTATSLAAPHYGAAMNQWPSTQMSRSARSSVTADFAIDGKLEEDPTARTHKLLKKPLFSHHHIHRPYHHFRENEENVPSQAQENKNLLHTEDKVELHLNAEHVDKTSGRNIGSDSTNIFEEKNAPKNVNEPQVMKEKENIDLTQKISPLKSNVAPIQDHAAQISMINLDHEHKQMNKNSMPDSDIDILTTRSFPEHSEAKNAEQTQMNKKMTDDVMMRKSRPHHFEARGAYDAGAGLGGGSAAFSSGGNGPVIGVFSNANIGGCAVPVLLSCSPKIVPGTLTKPHSYGYGTDGAPAYRTSEDFHKHNMREAMKKLL